jgi:hypothetical protein
VTKLDIFSHAIAELIYQEALRGHCRASAPQNRAPETAGTMLTGVCIPQQGFARSDLDRRSHVGVSHKVRDQVILTPPIDLTDGCKAILRSAPRG